MNEPAQEAEALKALQEGRYVLGHDITDVATVGAILVEAGLPKSAAVFEARSSALATANAERVAAGQKAMREFGSTGVPTLLCVEHGIRHLLDSKLLYGSSDALLALCVSSPSAIR